MSKEKRNIIITFGEHRNSDEFFVDHIYPLGYMCFVNPPGREDMTEDSYNNRHFFKSIDDSVLFIVKLLEGLN